jgi:cystathionine beta-lyase
MRFDFTSIMNRQGKDALAVDILGQPGVPGAPKEGFDAIPMWVADMNFATVPAVINAITARAQHPTFGYFAPRDEYYDAIIQWQKTQNHVTGLARGHIDYANGVVGGVGCALKTIASPGDPVLIHAPTYVGFTHVLEDNGYRAVHSHLQKDNEGIWRMDLVDMEEKIQSQQIHVAILCSPHNPCGRVWERWELEQAMELFRKYDVYVISDEIWSDLLLFGNRHIPTQSISEDAKMRTMSFYAPSKTFNLAGLVGSYSIIYNERLRHGYQREANRTYLNNMNVLSMHALIGAYSPEGLAWLTELRQVLEQNVTLACDYAEKHFPGVRVSRPQGTYMLFADCTQWCAEHSTDLDTLLRRCWDVGVALQDGRGFFGDCHMRINLALPTARVEEAFRRLKEFVFIL